MKKALLCASALVVSLSLALLGCTNDVNLAASLQTDKSDEEAVKNLVEDFGGRLKMVSLLAPPDIVNQSMAENYDGLVSPALLGIWQKDPMNAPGRLTSSPWPDRIEILSAGEVSMDEYQVKGAIIEVTSVEKESGGAAAKRPVTLAVKKIKGRWVIDDVTLGEYEGTASTVYRNTRYGFCFSLPRNWTGYSIVTKEWEGYALDSRGAVADEAAEAGPLILIRHPQWTEANQRQDIPTMVFTVSQWESLQKGEFHIGAAPLNPTELGHNTKYVFALPARYNYSFPEGYKEVEDILKNNPLEAYEIPEQ